MVSAEREDVTFRVLVTGSRSWPDEAAVWRALDAQLAAHPAGIVVIHGGARGADTHAQNWAVANYAAGHPILVEIHPAQWYLHGRAAGMIRNRQMVDRGAAVCLAFPYGESRGTRNCMAAAAKAGIAVIDGAGCGGA